MFNCGFGSGYLASVRDLTPEHLHNVTDLQMLKYVGKFLMNMKE